MNDYDYMRLALAQAEKALATGDVPIGAVAVYRGEIIGRGYNRREADHDPAAHAEMIAIREAAHHLGHWRLDGVTLYCTLEPCTDVRQGDGAGAAAASGLRGGRPEGGAAGGIIDVVRHPR
ncbi:MAG: nucleoside deaminase [Anaerolineae bacterium]